MRFYATASGPAVHDAMRKGLLGQIVTPAAGNRILDGVEWIGDNSVFGKSGYPGDAEYLKWIDYRAWCWPGCRFVVAPDVVGNAAATFERSAPMLAPIREHAPVAYVAQNGSDADSLPWAFFDAVFIGGTTEWKLGPEAREIVAEANRRKVWAHMGRVNSRRRLQYAAAIGCDSADGTFLAFGPDFNLPQLLDWLRELGHQPPLFEVST